MNSVAEFLKRASERNGFNRDYFEEKRIPTDFTNVCVFPFFGDLRSLTILSSYLLHRVRHELRGSKYFIVASWPGFSGLFPYADEYWSLSDESVIKKFYENSEGLRNKSDLNTIYIRNMNEFFRDVFDASELQKYYRNGFLNNFFDKFTNTKRFLPFIPSSTIIGKDFNKNMAIKSGYKIFIHPSLFCKVWQSGTSENVRAKKDFYVELCKYLSENNMTPVVWQNFASHDIAEEVKDCSIILRETDVVKVLSAMRSCSCVLDTFNSISRLAVIARCPFMCFDERSRYAGTREYEIDDLSGQNVPHQYIFSFSTILIEGDSVIWNRDTFPTIKNRLEAFVPDLNRDEWPSTVESTENVPYEKYVHPQKKKKIGTRFIRVPKE